MNITQVRKELARVSESAGPVAERAAEMLALVHQLVPFDAAWVARVDATGYTSVTEPDLPASVLSHLAGAKPARDTVVTGARDPLTIVALFEPGGRRVGFVALLFGDGQPRTRSALRRLAAMAPLLAHGIDPLRSAIAAGRMVADAYAGVLMLRSGGTSVLPGLDDDPVLRPESPLFENLRARQLTDESHRSFLWLRETDASSHAYVRVTWLSVDDPPAGPVCAVLLLSPSGDLHGLTPRELEVLGMMVDGCTNQQIADLLSVAPRTVAAHVEHILTKLDSPSRTHAAVRAQRVGLFVPGASSARAPGCSGSLEHVLP